MVSANGVGQCDDLFVRFHVTHKDFPAGKQFRHAFAPRLGPDAINDSRAVFFQYLRNAECYAAFVGYAEYDERLSCNVKEIHESPLFNGSSFRRRAGESHPGYLLSLDCNPAG